MSEKPYDELDNPIDPNDMNLFNPHHESLIEESYRILDVYNTIDEMMLYIVELYNKCADDIMLGEPIACNNRHEKNMYSLVNNFISLGYPKRLIVNNGTLKETNSTTNIDDFNKSLEMSIMSRLDMRILEMNKFPNVPKGAFFIRNKEPEHYGYRVYYRLATLPIAFQMKLPNMSIHSKAQNFLERFFYEFVVTALLRLYYTNYGALIRQVMNLDGGISKGSTVNGTYIISSVYELPVTELKLLATNAEIKDVDIKSVVSILDQNRTLIYPSLKI